MEGHPRRIATIFPPLGARAAASVSAPTHVELLDHLEREKGLGAQVNRTRTTLSSMFTFPSSAKSSPRTLSWGRRKDVERTRTLNDAELRAIWRRSTDGGPGRTFVGALVDGGADVMRSATCNGQINPL
jgi:hypothetical protein